MRERGFPTQANVFHVPIIVSCAKRQTHLNVFRVIKKKGCFSMKHKIIRVSIVRITLIIVRFAKTVHFATNAPIRFI